MKNVFAPIIREKDYLKLWFYRISVFYIIYNLNFLQGFQCKVKHISISLSIIPNNLSIAGETPLKSSWAHSWRWSPKNLCFLSVDCSPSRLTALMNSPMASRVVTVRSFVRSSLFSSHYHPPTIFSSRPLPLIHANLLFRRGLSLVDSVLQELNAIRAAKLVRVTNKYKDLSFFLSFCVDCLLNGLFVFAEWVFRVTKSWLMIKLRRECCREGCCLNSGRTLRNTCSLLLRSLMGRRIGWFLIRSF